MAGKAASRGKGAASVKAGTRGGKAAAVRPKALPAVRKAGGAGGKAGGKSGVAPTRAARLTPEQRRSQIVAAATDFFAEHGFEGGTSALARRLGITQPLLYRYFPTKADLISHVYEHAFPSAQYYPRWVSDLARRERPIRERLIDFYCEYTDVLLNYRFLRLAIWARLNGASFDGASFNERYNAVLTTRIFPLVIDALRERAGIADGAPPSEPELELMQTLHGSIYYVGIRRLNDRLPSDVRAIVVSKIDVFLNGISAELLRAGRTAPPVATGR